MSYKALYRTYRPRNFDSVVGQEHIVSTLKNIIKHNKIGHAYLFAGPRGTGKTSVAHIFAHSVNVNASGNAAYDEMDIVEIDAASNNGVPEIRNIINNITYAPTKAKYKVYIIDEVHMLTKAAFNALLKTLEEPPRHAIFILATTEPHKIPITIMSRVQRFNFKRIDEETIKGRLKMVLDKEEIKYDLNAIKFISKLAQGGMRDALSIADQAAAFGDGNITFNTISQVFGIVSIENQIKIINYAYAQQTRELMLLVNGFIQNGADIERISHSLLSIVKEYVVYNKTNDISLLSYISEEDYRSIKIDVDFAYEALEILMQLLTDLRFTPAPRQSFELSILKLSNINKSKQQPVVEEKIFVEDKTQVIDIEKTQEVIQVEEVSDNEVVDSKVIDELISDDTANLELEELFKVQEQTEEISSSTITEDLINTEDVERFEENMTITEDIISTQEINLTQDVVSEEDEDFDILKLFNTTNIEDGNKGPDPSHKRFVISEIINLLVQANKDQHIIVKANWDRLYDLRDDADFGYCADLLWKSKVISAGKDFILVSSEDPFVIDGIFVESTKNTFLKLIKKLVGRTMAVFAITKEEFISVKDMWQTLSTNNELPTGKAIDVPRIKEEKVQEAEYGEELFGDLFKK